jgi:hypothetical protein
MTDTTTSVALPKKRSLFKRAAWQDAPKKENEDIFSHSNEFPDIVAAQTKRKAEERKNVEAPKQRKNSEPHDRKRRRISNDDEERALPKSASSSRARPSRTSSKACVHLTQSTTTANVHQTQSNTTVASTVLSSAPFTRNTIRHACESRILKRAT